MKHFGRRPHDRGAFPFVLASALAGVVTASVVAILLRAVGAHPDPATIMVAQGIAVVTIGGATAALVWFAVASRSRAAADLRSLCERASRVASGDDHAGALADGLSGDPELASLARSIERMGAALRERTDTLSRKVTELSTLREVGRSAGRAGELLAALDAVMEAALRAVPAGRAYVALLEGDEGRVRVPISRGFAVSSSMAPDGSPAMWVLAQHRPIVLNPTGDGREADPYSGCVAAIAVPVSGPGGTIGALVLGSTDPLDSYSADDVRMLAAVSDQAALAVENARLVDTLQETYVATVRSLAAAIEARDAYTRGHSDRVAMLSTAMAAEMALSADQRTALEVASYLHDIGKIGIPEAILGKPARLDDAEFDTMKDHVTIGAAILSQVAFPWPVAPVVRHHHERWDGAGYPAGLAGEEIPLLARVLCVADSYEAMTSNRPYRFGCAPVEALAELQRHAGRQFDPSVVAAFTRVLEAEGVKVTPDVAAAVAPSFRRPVAEPAFG